MKMFENILFKNVPTVFETFLIPNDDSSFFVSSDCKGVDSADRLELLRLPELLLKVFALGDVETHADDAFGRPVDVDQRFDVALEVAAEELDGVGRRQSVQGAQVRRDRRMCFIDRAEEFEQVHAAHGVGRHA